ncbi:substrate-binding domain-containing protein [Burkholderia sp. Ac-20345]|uniref:ABC transporter substrate-binding protein n=1 Tax=Burkholderia sp. Ac-20345 TaxID=2703891 RepID=UPI00197C9403|nr:ABC transporter substrate-binding protein [Burkholderia sp. Ac-20345]MBN3781389.1 substrate-binding domain-containing protein [Burkholderia sp. Ac-20345]
MNRRQILVAGAGSVLNIATGGAAPSVAKARVVFLNPGESVERGTGQQWQLVSRFMSIAAKNFGMQLEVLYAERDHMLMLRQAEEVANRVDAPDYVVIVNEKMAALDMLQILSRTSSKIVLIHNDLTDEQRRIAGDERRRMRNWIGTLTADASSAGYRLMDYLCRDRRSARPHVIGITGDPNTPVSMERAAGVARWLARAPHARLNQLVFSNWSFSDSYEKALVLLARYPETNVIWGANDSITLAALKAAETRQVRAVVGGMGALPEALHRVMEGTLRAMMVGDYFIGALAMVLINDYHIGQDFTMRGGPRIKADFLAVVQAGNAASYYDAIFNHSRELDFGVYSKSRYRNDGPYDFRLSYLLGNEMATA